MRGSGYKYWWMPVAKKLLFVNWESKFTGKMYTVFVENWLWRCCWSVSQEKRLACANMHFLHLHKQGARNATEFGSWPEETGAMGGAMGNHGTWPPSSPPRSWGALSLQNTDPIRMRTQLKPEAAPTNQSILFAWLCADHSNQPHRLIQGSKGHFCFQRKYESTSTGWWGLMTLAGLQWMTSQEAPWRSHGTNSHARLYWRPPDTKPLSLVRTGGNCCCIRSISIKGASLPACHHASMYPSHPNFIPPNIP